MTALVRRSRTLALPLAAAALALCAALAALPSQSAPGVPPVDFSHVEHMTRQPDARCTDCHDVTRTTGAAPTWTATSCTYCHDDDIPAFAPRARGQQMAVAFSHGTHQARTGCLQCHEREGEDEAFTKPTKQACFSCHSQAEGDVPPTTSCKSCHEQDQRRVAPRSHDVTWTKRHGIHADPFHDFEHGQACTLCHKENSCVGCHQTQAPRDHTALWRERTHGAFAAWDRNRCKTCHETNQCIRCHTTNAPRNHRGAWQATHGLVARSRGDQSCLTCHRPASCVQCHSGNAP